MSKYHVEFDLDDSGELEFGDGKAADVEVMLKDTIMCALNVELTNIVITKQETANV